MFNGGRSMGSRTRGRRARRAACVLSVGALAAGVAACGGSSSGGGSSSSGGSNKGPIVIGLALAKTGALSPYDLQPGQALELRIDEINKAGGVNGRKLEAKWIDTKSDKTLAATVAGQLIDQGAVAIIDTCDFDYGSPATFAAKAKNV